MNSLSFIDSHGQVGPNENKRKDDDELCEERFRVEAPLAIKTSKVSRAANKVRRSREIIYWKGHQAGYSSAMKKQKWQCLRHDPEFLDQDEPRGTDDINGDLKYEKSQEDQDTYHEHSEEADDSMVAPPENSAIGSQSERPPKHGTPHFDSIASLWLRWSKYMATNIATRVSLSGVR